MRTSSTGLTDEDRVTVRTLECNSLTPLIPRQLALIPSGQLTQEERPSGLNFIRHKSLSDLRCNKLTEPSEADADVGTFMCLWRSCSQGVASSCVCTSFDVSLFFLLRLSATADMTARPAAQLENNPSVAHFSMLEIHLTCCL